MDPDDSGVSDLLNTDDHIQYLFGYPEGTFGPENNMTRAEVAQMFYNLLLDQDVTITKTFNDVPANAWYTKAVNTLASLGVVSGVGNGDFEPGALHHPGGVHLHRHEVCRGQERRHQHLLRREAHRLVLPRCGELHAVRLDPRLRRRHLPSQQPHHPRGRSLPL